MTNNTPSKSPDSSPCLSELELAHLRARFHATQFRYTSALAAESGKTNDGVFRIQMKPDTASKNITKKPRGDQWELIEDLHGSNPDDCCPLEVLEPEFDFSKTKNTSGSDEEDDVDAELAPNEIEEYLDHDHRAWLDEILEADPDVSQAVKTEISKRKTERSKHKTVREKKKEKAKEAINGYNYSSRELVPVPSLNPSQPGNENVAQDSGLGITNDQPFVPVYVGSQELLIPGEKIDSAIEPSSNATSADPLFDCVEEDIVLDDQYLSEIATGLREGVTYDDTYVTDDLKRKLLDIEANKDKVDNQIAVKALETPVKTDETAQKIVQALTNQDVISKTVDVEDSKILKDYFSGARKVDDEVLSALNRVIDRILDRAPEFYNNKEELAVFMRNRATAKMHLLDAMLAMKGGWLSNLYGSAYSTALAVVAGVNATVEAVNKGVLAAKEQAAHAKKIAEQSATAARELMSSEVVTNASRQAMKLGSMAAVMAGAVASTVSNATSALSATTSTTDTTSAVSTVPSTATAAPSITSVSGSVSTTTTTGSTDTSTSVSTENVPPADQTPDEIAPDAVTTDTPTTNGPPIDQSSLRAASPAVLTFNGFMHCDPPSESSPIPATGPQPFPTDKNTVVLSPGNESVMSSMWSAFLWVLNMPYGIDAVGPDSPSNNPAPPPPPPQDEKKKE